MGESLIHMFFKEEAKKQLIDEGFSCVFKEHNVMVEGRTYRVDVVGFMENKSIAIECGYSDWDKLQSLRKIFTEVRVMPYSENTEIIDSLLSNERYLFYVARFGRVAVRFHINKLWVWLKEGRDNIIFS